MRTLLVMGEGPEVPPLEIDLVDDLSDAIIATDLSFVIQGWNRAAEQIYGWTASEAIGRRLLEVVPAGFFGTAHQDALRQLHETGRWRGESDQARSDGARLHVLTSASQLRDGAGQPAGVVAVIRDLTERTRAEHEPRDATPSMGMQLCAPADGPSRLRPHGVVAACNEPQQPARPVGLAPAEFSERQHMEEALRESQQMLRAVLDAIPVRVFWKDRASRYLGCNRSFALDGGLGSPETIVGMDDFQMGWAPQADLYRADDQRVIESGEPKLNYEEPQTTPQGNTIWLRTSKVPLLGADGQITGVLGTYEDITQWKQAQAELQRLYEVTRHDSETKSELLKEINHRVKNNLVAVLGLLLAEKRHAPPGGRQFVERSMDNMASRIHGMLEVHQLLSESQWAPMRLADLVERIIRTAFGASDRQATVEIEAKPATLEVSPRQASTLALVVNELATNTHKAMLASGRQTVRIGVRAWAEDGHIALEVRDDGPGYPEEVLSLARYGVGLYLLQQLVTGTLRGSLTLANNGGAVAILRFKTEERHRT